MLGDEIASKTFYREFEKNPERQDDPGYVDGVV